MDVTPNNSITPQEEVLETEFEESGEISNYFYLSPYFVDDESTPGFDYKRYQDKIDAMPELLYNLLIDEKAYQTILTLEENYQLSEDQAQDLARVIRDVILADIYWKDLAAVIQQKLGLQEQAARDIANVIASEILQPVAEEFQKWQNEKFKLRTPQENQQTPVQPEQISNQPLPRAQPNPPKQGIMEAPPGVVNLRDQK